MSFNISEFKGAMSIGNGVARPTMYAVNIEFNKLNGLGRRQLRILCESAELPGRRLDTTPELMYGVSRKMPFGTVYEDLSLTFICLANMEERYYFDRWYSFICDPSSNYMHYFDDYKADITIDHFDSTGRPKYTIVVEEAYPVSVIPQPISYGDENNYLKMTVDFTYKRWRNNREIQANSQRAVGYGFKPRIIETAGGAKFPSEYVAPTGSQIDSQQDYSQSFGDNITVSPFGGGDGGGENTILGATAPAPASLTNDAADAGPGSRVDAVQGAIVTPNESLSNTTPAAELPEASRRWR